MNETTPATVVETPAVETPTVETPAAETQKVNKSKLVITAFREMTDKLATPANDVIDHIRQSNGVAVTVSLVNNIRCKLKAKRAERADKISKGKRRKRKAAPVVETPVPVLPTPEEREKMLIVKEAAAKVGGMDALKELVAKLENLAAVAKELSALAA
jgi:hypothetical protein